MAFTFFFRDGHTIDLIEAHALPVLRNRSYIDIWDAGCATGAEPFTLAIRFREKMGQFEFRKVRIYATDLNPQFAETIGNACYSDEETKRIPKEIFGKYFSPATKPDSFVLCDELRNVVKFSQHDLTCLKPVKTGLSLIICKNVLLHINQDTRLEVLKMFHDSLGSDGFLATEPTQKMPPEGLKWFEPVHADGPLFRKAA